ncbi:hypothetical protein KIH31_08060 [Paenarthrobacter sp. DKR-5]|uniref:hypothetical protein n=1 Tax=Paenarthrobacter sp. DKR-5 TaxID=2835535 RepID=UPI001BDD6498|nr:hypothetical protein [Paenarthrobacter sp. DKR-5]MBT1002557.1 hypothetical protein [Paenarthrobacter sp. DKR-5]
MTRLRAVPPLTPEQAASSEPEELEEFIRHPGDTWASGGYLQWRGTLYEYYRIGTDVWLEYREAGHAPQGWETRPGSYDPRSGLSTFRRQIARDEIERYVRVTTKGMWHGFEFLLGKYVEDGTVMTWGGGQELADLIEAGGAPRLETSDRGRSVTGLLPWAELSDVRQEMKEEPLPW